MANYEQEVANFRQKWNLPNYDLHQLANSVQRLRFADSFLMGATSDNSPQGQFAKWFSRTLSHYFEANTTPNANGKYMSSFNAQAFYDSFKALVQAKYDADAQEKQEEPLQVDEVVKDMKSTLERVIANCKRTYKKTLPALWMEELKAGTLNMQNLQSITSQSFDAIHKKWYVDGNEMAGNLTNIVAAREAMQQLRASRSGVWGWLWKVIFRRDQNRQEKEYLQQLENQITQLQEKGYKLDEVTRNLTETTVLGRDVNAQNQTTRTQDKKVKQVQESPVENKNAIEPVAGKISEMANDEFINNLAAALEEELPGNGMAKIVRVWQYQSVLLGLRDKINELNENFDRAVQNGADPKKEMAKVVHGIFKETDKVFSANMTEMDKVGFAYMTETGLDKMEGLKIAAEMIINKLTPVAIYPNELGDVVNTYIEQNLAIYEEIVTAGKEYSQEIENYKKMLEEDVVSENDYEPAFGEDNPFIEKNVGKVAPVSAPPQINAPTVEINKK